MTKGLLTLISILLCTHMYAVTCTNGGTPFTTQAEVNAVAAMGCDTIDYIKLGPDNASDPIVDLSPFSGITVVMNNVEILGLQQLTTLNGLESLTNINLSLLISQNPNLQQINALGNSIVAGAIVIQQNPALASCCGIQNAIATPPIGGIFLGDKATLANAVGCQEIAEILADTSCQPVTASAQPVPTLGEWALINLFLLFSILGVISVREKYVLKGYTAS